MRISRANWWSVCAIIILCGSLPAQAQRTHAQKIGDAASVLDAFTADENAGIPADLLARAKAVAILPDVFRGGFFIGGRRGRGVITVKTAEGQWTNPAFLNLTGGSIGWQFGGETMDLVLVFANDNAVKNITRGKFTLGGDAAAVAGPLGRRATMAMTFKAEVYSYVRSSGLFAGAAFEGARLAIDTDAATEFYEPGAVAFGPLTSATPASVRRLVALLNEGSVAGASPPPPVAPAASESASEVRTFPLGN